VEKLSSKYFTDDSFKIILQMLGMIICWPLTGGQKPYNYTLATAKR